MNEILTIAQKLARFRLAQRQLESGDLRAQGKALRYAMDATDLAEVRRWEKQAAQFEESAYD